MKTKTWLKTFVTLATAWMAVGRIEAQAQPAWFNPSTPGTRCCFGMVFDPGVNSTLLFGGYGGPNNPDLGDTWVLGEGGWFQLSPTNSPPPRSGAGMAYDASTKTVVMFGGNSRSGGDLNDTWIWNGTNWTQVFPPVSPPARRWDTQGMAYHAPSGKVVLFGGVTSGGTMLGGHMDLGWDDSNVDAATTIVVRPPAALLWPTIPPLKRSCSLEAREGMVVPYTATPGYGPGQTGTSAHRRTRAAEVDGIHGL